jgi:hypothetical protein
LNYISRIKNLLYLKALFYFGVPGAIAHQGVLQRLKRILMVRLRSAISIGDNNFAESISCASRGLHAQLTTQRGLAAKKNCWMKKNWARNGVTIAPIAPHRANHPNHLVIRGRVSEPEFRF